MRRRFMSGNGIPDNQIWYTSNDGNIIDVRTKPSSGTVDSNYGLGSVIMSNQYYDKGIIKTAGNVTQIGVNAFNGKTSLVSITLPSQVAVIYNNAFEGCTSLTSITIPDGVTSIEGWAFRDCTSLTSVTIPDSVTSIEGRAFRDCTSLTSVTIPDSVTSIGYEAFRDCTSLKEVYCKATTPPTGESYMFSSNASNRKIYVPRNSVNAYKSATYWSNYASYIEGYDF